jgi:hypothetical protein
MKRDPWFERILRVYPRAFRGRFADELRALHNKSSNNRLERRRFLTDLLLGAIGERLQSVQWIRFIAAFGLGATALWSLAGLSFFRETATTVISSVWFTALMSLGWYLLPFALIARLNRTPTLAEALPLMSFLAGVVAFGLSGIAQNQINISVLVFATAYYGGFAFYGCVNLRHSSNLLRLLKLSTGAHALAMIAVTWAVILGLPYTPNWAFPWEVIRTALIAAMTVGLILPITKPGATTTPAT